MIWYKKFLLLLTLITLITLYKSTYIIIFLILFSLEHLYFLSYVKKIFIKDKYIYIEPEYKQLDNLVDLWICYCKLSAFKRIYLLCKKPKINLLSIPLNIIIILLGIPIKVLQLINFLIKYSSLKEGISSLYFVEYNRIKNCKIENLKGKILLNNQIETFFRIIINSNNELLKDKIKMINCTLQLQDVINNIIIKNENKKTPINLIIPFRDNKKICHWHPGQFFEKNKIMWHFTSNLKNIDKMYQKELIWIPGLIKNGAENPATICTSQITHIIKDKTRPPIEINSNVLSAFKCINIEELGVTDITAKEYNNYLNDKKKIEIIFKEHGILNDKLINELIMGHFNEITLLDTTMLIQELNNFINNN